MTRCVLVGGRPDVVLEQDGFHHPRSARSRKTAFTRYADLVHVSATDRAIWLASHRDVTVLPRKAFLNDRGPEQLLGALVDRLARLPSGPAQLARMALLDERGRRISRAVATRSLMFLCLAAFVLQIVDWLDVYMVGFFNYTLFVGGDWWRPVTGNLLHGFPLHLATNLIGLWLLGRLVERSLGGVRTICVMVASGLGAMLTCALLVSGDVVGVSGVVLGLAGAVLWVDIRLYEELPAWWRFPRFVRRFLVVALLADLSLGFVIPMVSGEAHLGGFVAGVLAAAVVAPRGSIGLVPSTRLRSAAAFVSALVLVSIGGAVIEIRGGDYVLRNADHLLEATEIPPQLLNNLAWMIAIDDHASREQLRGALRLAERAVSETEAGEPTLLDTLAEVQFQLGDEEMAIDTIDRAIALDPDEDYYREQRRRFTGERAADDRPPDPQMELFERDKPPLPPDTEGLQA